MDIVRENSGITCTYYCRYSCILVIFHNFKSGNHSSCMLFKTNKRTIQLIWYASINILIYWQFKCIHIFLLKYVHDLIIKVSVPSSLSCGMFVYYSIRCLSIFVSTFFMNCNEKFATEMFCSYGIVMKFTGNRHDFRAMTYWS